jgi:hypothetical protein
VSVLDLLWGTYYATGETRAVQRIIKTLAWMDEADPGVDPALARALAHGGVSREELLTRLGQGSSETLRTALASRWVIGAMARWSLGAMAAGDPRVRDLCAAALPGSDGVTRAHLQEVLAPAEETR